MILPIYIYGHSILRTACEEIDSTYPELDQLIHNNFETFNNSWKDKILLFNFNTDVLET